MPADITLAKVPYLYEVSTSEVWIALDATKCYSIYHTGKDSAGAASTGDVYGQVGSGAVVASYANGDGKFVLQNGNCTPLPEQITRVNLKTASGSVSLQFLAAKRVVES